VRAVLRSVEGSSGPRALCIDFDFRPGDRLRSARAAPICRWTFPRAYEFTMQVRGDAPPNAFPVQARRRH